MIFFLFYDFLLSIWNRPYTTLHLHPTQVPIKSYDHFKYNSLIWMETKLHVRHSMSSLQGFRYKMRSVYAHFPINVAISENNTVVDIRNFLGEKYNRQVRMLPGVTCVASKDMKDEFVLDGNDIELVSRSGWCSFFSIHKYNSAECGLGRFDCCWSTIIFIHLFCDDHSPK